MKLKKDKKSKKTKNIIILSLFVIVLIFGAKPLYKSFVKSQVTYNIVNGYVEKTSSTTAYIVKKETVLDIDKTSSTVPIVEQYKRTSKGDIIAVYKNNKYEEYLKKIESMDKEIQTLIKDLPVTYSNEVESIDDEIAKLSKELVNVNSYVKMQEYKSKIDELSYKKVITLGEISPAGSKIKEYIEQRKAVEEESKKSSDSIKATASGSVTYKVDSLENIVDIDKLLNSSDTEIEKLIEKYNQNVDSNYGIKIVDNFKAYIIIKEPIGKNDDYIKEKNNYEFKMLDKEKEIFTGKLVKNIKNSSYNYCIFEINEGIEKIIDLRNLNVEITWTKVKGTAVLLEGIKKDSNTGYEYINILKTGKYLKVPVVIKISSDGIAIIENMSNEKRKELKIENTDTFSLYDQVIIQE